MSEIQKNVSNSYFPSYYLGSLGILTMKRTILLVAVPSNQLLLLSQVVFSNDNAVNFASVNYLIGDLSETFRLFSTMILKEFSFIFLLKLQHCIERQQNTQSMTFYIYLPWFLGCCHNERNNSTCCCAIQIAVIVVVTDSMLQTMYFTLKWIKNLLVPIHSNFVAT
jgi:hypothetical protein